jgi:hypothetical protein
VLGHYIPDFKDHVALFVADKALAQFAHDAAPQLRSFHGPPRRLRRDNFTRSLVRENALTACTT